ncbi:MAG: hypothetical protein HC802_14245, partial [Caldilineaceae bacterium]|nr:hypothetical protein [Caldilineaceae bacterium]
KHVATQSVLAIALLAVFVWGAYPNIEWQDYLAADHLQIDQSMIARYESNAGALGTSWSGEFTPKWVEGLSLEGESLDADPGPLVDVQLLAAGPQSMTLSFTASQPSRLRFQEFYFPGWALVIEGGERLTPYPSTSLGLLTVDVPAGTHSLAIHRKNTFVENAGTAIALIALLFAIGLVGWRCRRCRLVALTLGCLIAGLLIVDGQREVSLHALQEPAESLETCGFELLGFYAVQSSPTMLNLHPYWYVESTPGELEFVWQLTNENDEVVSVVVSSPYFDTLSSADWPVHTVVDDAYQLPLPPDLAQGVYQLRFMTKPPDQGETDCSSSMTQIGDVAIQDAPTILTPDVRMVEPAIRFSDPNGHLELSLVGYDFGIVNWLPFVERDVVYDHPVLKPGDRLQMDLHWTADGEVKTLHRSFLQLLDADRRAVAQVHKGMRRQEALFPNIWAPNILHTESYDLSIPSDVASGLYQPT